MKPTLQVMAQLSWPLVDAAAHAQPKIKRASSPPSVHDYPCHMMLTMQVVAQLCRPLTVHVLLQQHTPGKGTVAAAVRSRRQPATAFLRALRQVMHLERATACATNGMPLGRCVSPPSGQPCCDLHTLAD